MPLRGELSPGANRRSGSGSMAGMSGTAGGNYTFCCSRSQRLSNLFYITNANGSSLSNKLLYIYRNRWRITKFRIIFLVFRRSKQTQ